MDISGAQLNSAAITAYNAQLQAGLQQNRQAGAPVESRPLAAEVTLSSEAKDRSAGESRSATVSVANSPEKLVAQAPEPQSSLDDTGERQAVQAREAENRQQSSRAAQTNANTFAAQQAVQSYFNVANF